MGFFTVAGGIDVPIVQTGLQFAGVDTVELRIAGERYCDVVPDLTGPALSPPSRP